MDRNDGEQSWRSRRRRTPIGQLIVIAGLFLPMVCLTSCDALESSASGIALIAAPAEEALPAGSGPAAGSTGLSQAVTGLIPIIAVVSAVIQLRMRWKVLTPVLVVVLAVLGIAALPVLDWSLELAVSGYSVAPSLGMVTIGVGFGLAGVSSWYWLLSDNDRPRIDVPVLGMMVAGLTSFGALLNLPAGWPIGLAPFLVGIITALFVVTAWLGIWTMVLLVRRLRSRAHSSMS